MDVYTKCAILIPPVKLKKTDRFKIAVYSFWNRDKVEELISELKNRVDKSFRLFFVRISEIYAHSGAQPFSLKKSRLYPRYGSKTP